MVEDHRVVSVPYHSVQVDLNINPHLSSEYINHLENPMEIINEAERVAGEDIWSLMQFTENFRRQYGKEPRPMELILKKLYLRRMAADIGVTRIYSSGKTVFMKTNMNKKVFKMMTESMTSDIYKDSLVLEGDQIKCEHAQSATYKPFDRDLAVRFQCKFLFLFKPKIPSLIFGFSDLDRTVEMWRTACTHEAELLLELPKEQLLNWIFNCMAELHASLAALIKY
uniref:HMG-I and HMG-Y, DNA-binding, putative n=1 Tax=Medicago truncatula TaxID=3880 RepID=Q2HRW7_MEDTR|nr:HMG-I and HMG-Y, DNA-binding, putative [Medicago truncatula]